MFISDLFSIIILYSLIIYLCIGPSICYRYMASCVFYSCIHGVIGMQTYICTTYMYRFACNQPSRLFIYRCIGSSDYFCENFSTLMNHCISYSNANFILTTVNKFLIFIVAIGVIALSISECVISIAAIVVFTHSMPKFLIFIVTIGIIALSISECVISIAAIVVLTHSMPKFLISIVAIGVIALNISECVISIAAIVVFTHSMPKFLIFIVAIGVIALSILEFIVHIAAICIFNHYRH